MIKRRILVKHGVMIVLSVGLFTGTVFGQFNVSGYEQDQSQGTSTQVAQTAPAPQALAPIPPQTMARSVMTNDNILRMVKSGHSTQKLMDWATVLSETCNSIKMACSGPQLKAG